jgi:hypothetical protein
VADRAYWQARADALDEAHARGRIEDAQWFAEMAAIFEAAYLAGDNPRARRASAATRRAVRRPASRLRRRSTATEPFSTSAARATTCSRASSRGPPHRIEPYGLDLAPALVELARQLVERPVGEVVVPAARLILCGYGSPRSGVLPDPVCATVRSWGFEPELELCAPAPEGGPIVEVAALGA